MSGTEALGVTPNRRPITLATFSNGHGWAPSIWRRLLKEHYGYDGVPYFGEGERLLDQLWGSIESLPEWQQVPLVLTFDTGVIPWQEYANAADRLGEFERRFPVPDGHANHVPAMIEVLRSEPESPLIGVWGTSVSENPFDPWNEDADEPGSGIPLREMYVLARWRHHFVVGGRFDDPH